MFVVLKFFTNEACVIFYKQSSIPAFQDTLHARKLQPGADPGVRGPGEGARKSPLLHDDYGDSFDGAQC